MFSIESSPPYRPYMSTAFAVPRLPLRRRKNWQILQMILWSIIAGGIAVGAAAIYGRWYFDTGAALLLAVQTVCLVAVCVRRANFYRCLRLKA